MSSPHKQSPSAPGMSYEFEAACHNMSRHVLRAHLDGKYGVGKWAHAGMGMRTEEKNGVLCMSNDDLSKNSLECGLQEMRRQLLDYDAGQPANRPLFEAAE